MHFPECGPFPQFPETFSADGKTLIFTQTDFTDSGIWSVSIDDDPTSQALVKSEYSLRNPMLSPDGRWLAYASDESGDSEIIVQPYPALDRELKISIDGGADPKWSRDGKELYYRYEDGIWGVRIEDDSTFKTSSPELLFEGNYMDSGGHDYDVAPDGRFLMVEESAQQPAPTELVVVQGWFDELERLAPTEKESR